MQETHQNSCSGSSDAAGAPKTPWARARAYLSRFGRDGSGNYTVIVALLSPVLIGCTGLATEGGLWLYEHQTLQGAADSAALSAASRYTLYGSTGLDTQADSVVASYGYTAGVNGTTVTVNNPPSSGHYTSNQKAVEVIVSIQQTRLLSGIFSSAPVTIKGRAVAVAGSNGNGCVLSLAPIGSGATTSQGTSDIDLRACSIYDNSSDASALVNGGSATIEAASVNVVGGVSGSAGITTTDGLNQGTAPAADPYAGENPPSFSGCDYNNATVKDTETLNPGVYCNGLQINAGAVVTLNPGTYYIDRGTFKVNGGATITGTGVTIVFTSSTGKNYATADINGGATINITAPTSGDTAGIVIFGDRNMPVGTNFTLNGDSNQYFGGAVYLPQGAINYSGGAQSNNGCTQLIGYNVNFTGNANLAVDCSSQGTKNIGISTASLVE